MGSQATATPVKALLQPFTLGDLPLPNRMVLPPLTRGRATADHIPTPLMGTYYAQRASAGLLISEGTFVSPAAIGWPNAPEVYSPEAVAAWRGVTGAVAAAGGRIFCQLWHTGRASHSSFRADGSRGVAPSAVAIRDDGGIHLPGGGKAPHEVPHAMTVDEIRATVDDYVVAAKNAIAAGFDGVEIHSANGYLLDSFLQTGTNRRTDEYGAGSLESRFRFLREVVTAVTAVVPANRVGVRLSPNGVFNDQGSPDFREAFPYFASQLDSFGLAYLHVLVRFEKRGGGAVGTCVVSEPRVAACVPAQSGCACGGGEVDRLLFHIGRRLTLPFRVDPLMPVFCFCGFFSLPGASAVHSARWLWSSCLSPAQDGLAFGFHKLGEPLTLKDFRAVFKGPLMANCGYTAESGEAAIVSGAADLVSYGRAWISNPDLPRRFADGLPLNADASMATWYSSGAEGYTTYPTVEEADAGTKAEPTVEAAEGDPEGAKAL